MARHPHTHHNKTAESQAAGERAFDALALTRRRGLSLTRAARETRTTRRTVLRHVGQGFRREGRRWVPRPFDRLPREVTILTEAGPVPITVHDSRTASLIARHANAVQEYLRTGSTQALASLPRRSFRLRGRTFQLLADEDLIDRLAEGGELHYELYRR